MSGLKPGWRRVKFGEIVRQVKDKADPETSGLERFVAGEHMDTDDLRIRRWGDIGGGYLGPAFHARFRPGQVLYGSRRTYLRKVAVPDFEGICANTTFVLESADPRILLPELLPFIMQTEGFHEHSKRESKGSVNPYVNFSDLAWYELALPPLAEQRRMVDSAKATMAFREALADVIEASSRLGESFCVHVVESCPLEDQVQVGEICKFTSGKSIPVTSLPQQASPGASIPVYGGNGLTGFTTAPLPSTTKPTVVVGRVGQFCGTTRLTSGPSWITDNALYPASVAEGIEMGFLALALRGRRINKGKLGEYLPLITQAVVHAIAIPLPSRADQKRMLEALNDIESATTAARSSLKRAEQLHHAVLGELTS